MFETLPSDESEREGCGEDATESCEREETREEERLESEEWRGSIRDDSRDEATESAIESPSARDNADEATELIEYRPLPAAYPYSSPLPAAPARGWQRSEAR